jgi:DNA-binding response OmpR family regulator
LTIFFDFKRQEEHSVVFLVQHAKKPWGNKIMANFNREKKRVLVVEDHEEAREIVAFVLEDYALFYARNFNKGLHMARLGYFDLYILDNWLPGGNGVELCRVIRRFDPHTPILFYSACAYSSDLHAAYSAGAQEYFVKPVSFGELEQAVAKLTSPVSERDSAAWWAEIAAIREEFAIRQMKNAERVESAKEKRQRAEEKLMRLKAEKAFLGAGGTRGEFARRWPSVLTEEVRNHHTSDAARGN